MKRKKVRANKDEDSIIFVDRFNRNWTVSNLKELVDACYSRKKFEEVFEYYFD